MKKRMLVIAAMVAWATAPETAQADLIAGWDFSQYATAGRLTIDGTTPIDTLAANYSSSDASFGAGSGAAAAGTMYMDGSNGSTNVNEAFGSASVVPTPKLVNEAEDADTNGAIEANLDLGDNTDPYANMFSVLRSEGQTNTQLLSLLALSSANVVFEGVVPTSNWSVSFGGRALPGTSPTVGVSFAPNCGAYGSVTNVNLTQVDTAYDVVFANGTGASNSGCVRMAMGANAIIDNVAILPEPAAGLGLLAGGALLAALRRRS